jgi:hypothetical protein
MLCMLCMSNRNRITARVNWLVFHTMSTSSQLKTADVYIVYARIAIMVEVPDEV